MESNRAPQRNSSSLSSACLEFFYHVIKPKEQQQLQQGQGKQIPAHMKTPQKDPHWNQQQHESNQIQVKLLHFWYKRRRIVLNAQMDVSTVHKWKSLPHKSPP